MVTDADRQVRRIRREPDPAAEIVLAVRFRRGSHNRLGVQLRLVRLNMTMEGIMDSSNKRRRVFVDICHGTDLLSSLRGSRDVDYMTVEQRPASTFRFRFRLNEDSHDDSTGRNFDLWLEDLRTMATEAREQGGAAPEMSVFERVYENRIYYQNMWTGFLGKDAPDSPRRAGNGLLQFELKAASFSRTWTAEESLPVEERWADRLREDGPVVSVTGHPIIPPCGH